ncbi:26S proteasome non-ATPase regulatory subunit 6 [Sarcoptes scabiei]|nr:26S proteasome non-ATPase regulatory subunit 6 [Sarcoptes scabiei]
MVVSIETFNRTRSASVGRMNRNVEHRRFRYWSFLFDHLNRIIDEIYQNCEEDESIDQCLEVCLNLQNHLRDFESLIEWLKLNKNLELMPQRPNSVAWEVRKRLPQNSIFSCYLNAQKRLDSNKKVGNQNNIKTNEDQSVAVSGKVSFDTFCSNNSTKIISLNNSSNQVISHHDHSDDHRNESMPNICAPRFDDDGFQMVRYRNKNKVAQLKIINHGESNDQNNNSNNNHTDAVMISSEPWSLLDNNNVMGDSRAPCRVLKFHEKFSSSPRRRPISDQLRKHEEKQAKAQEAREKLLEKKAEKFKDISKKVEEIKAQKEEHQMLLKISMQMRLRRADEKRQEQINKIVRKAHDEDEKVSEILFINSLEADTKKHEIFSKEKVHESRLQDLQEERQRKLEEKASKEKAFEKRRKAIEAAEQARIEKLKEQRKLKVMKIQKQFQEKEKERLELAFQKELDRKSKISALFAMQEAEKEELQKKIMIKQKESKKRHDENMEHIRQKALELSVKKSSSTSDEALVCVPYDTIKMCALCKVIIKSEVYLFGHLRGRRHNDAIKEQNDGKIPSPEELENFNLRFIIDAPSQTNDDCDWKLLLQDCDSEKLKNAKKKSKKLRQKLINRATSLNGSSLGDLNFDQINYPKENKQKYSKLFKELIKLNSNDRISGQWPSDMIRNFDRCLSELEKLFKSKVDNILYFYQLDGLTLLTKILSRILNGTSERPTSLSDNANNRLIALYTTICCSDFRICRQFIQSLNIISIIDIFLHRINLCIETNLNASFPYDSVVGSLCEQLSAIFESVFAYYSTNYSSESEEFEVFIRLHIKEIINYLVIIGVVDKLSIILTSIRGSINDLPKQSLFVKQTIVILSSLAKLLTLSSAEDFREICFGVKLKQDDTQYMLTLKVTQLCGIVSLLYGFLLHSGTPVRDDNVPPIVPNHTLEVVLEIIKFFNYLSLLDINLIQLILGSEGLSLQIRHICSYLIWYCSFHQKFSELLHEVILFIGNFVVLNPDNQTLLQSGQRPTVVQQLCALPFEYFSDEKYKQILLPTLIVCCFHNEDNLYFLKQEMSTELISKFIDQMIVLSQIDQLDLNKNRNIISEKLVLQMRFPKQKWIEAKSYFQQNHSG